MTLDEERKAQLIEENEWLPKAIEMLNMRLLDKGFNCNVDWLGYYDEYVVCYKPRKHWSAKDECYETLKWGDIEIHSKTKVFNPYKFVGGDGYEYEKLAEIDMITEHMWEIIEKYIIYNDYHIDGKKIDIHSDPYYERPRFINGSDVPINGYYE